MGVILSSYCGSCGIIFKSSFGGGRFNYTTYCPVPALNKQLNSFVTVNYYEFKDSPDYLFYTDDALKGNYSENSTITNFDLKLNTAHNYCPNCKEQALNFRVTSYYD